MGGAESIFSVRPAVSKWAKANSTSDIMLVIKANSVTNFLNLNFDLMVNFLTTHLVCHSYFKSIEFLYR